MDAAKGLAFCGLACCACSKSAACPGCRSTGCQNADACRMTACCRAKGLSGCWQCADFPCGEALLQKPRVRAFGRYAAAHGEAALLARLAQDEAAGVRYHFSGLLTGDYDTLGDEDAILSFLETECTLLPVGALDQYCYVVVFCEWQGELLLSRHKRRVTWETQGGHLEPGETPEQAARREVWEESGADCLLTPLCDYRVGQDGAAGGRAYVAQVRRLGALPESEMAETRRFPTLPELARLTYPAITPFLWAEALRQGVFRPCLLRGFWQDVLRQDAAALARYFAADAQVLWPNTRERFTAPHYIQANCAYPGQWRGGVEQAAALADGRWLTVTLVQGGGVSLHALSLITFDAHGKILRLEEYWSDDGPVPAWRQALGVAEPAF